MLVEHSGGARWIARQDERRLLTLFVDDATGLLSEDVALPPHYFSCLLLCDATEIPDELGVQVASRLLESGAGYLCAWGPECRRVHNFFDDAHLERQQRDGVEYELMTTDHHDETLDDALWLVLYCAIGAEVELGSCLIISVGNVEWDRQVQARLEEVEAFSETMTGPE